MVLRLLSGLGMAVCAVAMLEGGMPGALALLQRPERDATPPDLVLYHGRFFTGDAGRWAEAMAIRDGRIAAVGTTTSMRRLAGARTRLIDVQDRVVVPGLNDSHVHLGYNAPIGATLPGDPANWSEGPDAESVLAGLAALAARTPPGVWLRADMGLRIRNSSLRRDALDKVAPNHPVLLKASYGHGSMVNTQALKLLGLSDSPEDPEGGWFERVAGRRTITGVLEGTAQYDAWDAYFSSDPSAMTAELRRNAATALRFGITTLQHMPSLMSAAHTEKAFRDAALPVRVRIVQWPYPGRLAEWTRLRGTRPSRLTYISGVKYVLDGTPLEGWALMKRDYDGRPGWRGRSYYSIEAIRELLKQALHDTDPYLLHVTGDRTAELVLQMMDDLAPASTWRARPVRFEHAPGVTGTNVDLAQRYGILIAQPRGDSTLLRSWHAADIRLAHGSDGDPGNPWVSFMNAAADGQDRPGLSRTEALLMCTRGSAYAESAERDKGALRPGMLADIAVLSQDVFSVPRAALARTESILTLVGGEVAYDAGLLTSEYAQQEYPRGVTAEFAEARENLSIAAPSPITANTAGATRRRAPRPPGLPRWGRTPASRRAPSHPCPEFPCCPGRTRAASLARGRRQNDDVVESHRVVAARRHGRVGQDDRHGIDEDLCIRIRDRPERSERIRHRARGGE